MSTAPQSTSGPGWLTSLAFWTCLVFAAALFTAAALSSKWLAYLQLAQRHHANQLRLVALEQDDQKVQKIIVALKDDPRYARELARLDFAASPGSHREERIPVEASLAIEAHPAAPSLSVTEPDLPWYAVLVAIPANDARVNITLLVAAALLVVYAFGFLQS